MLLGILWHSETEMHSFDLAAAEDVVVVLVVVLLVVVAIGSTCFLLAVYFVPTKTFKKSKSHVVVVVFSHFSFFAYDSRLRNNNIPSIQPGHRLTKC